MEDDEYEYEEVPVLPSFKFSWWGVCTDLSLMVANVLMSFGQFWESTSQNFARAHNRSVDQFDAVAHGEKFAREVLSGIDEL